MLSASHFDLSVGDRVIHRADPGHPLSMFDGRPGEVAQVGYRWGTDRTPDPDLIVVRFDGMPDRVVCHRRDLLVVAS